MLPQNMRCAALTSLLLLLLLAPIVTASTGGRDAPNCTELEIAQVSTSIAVSDAECIKISLGNLQPGDVYDVSVSVINDALDVLFFDQNQILTYDAGQSYRSQFNPIISTENALGGYDFHWKVPASINPKTYYLVLDNLDHDGDNGQGDLGGNTSQAGVSFTKIDESYWTPYHDVLAVDANDYATLLSGDDLKLDAGTLVVVTAWALDGQANVYLQTRNMHEFYANFDVGQLTVADFELQSVAGIDSDSWTVPEELAGEELLIIVDNTNASGDDGDGSSSIRVSVRVELFPQVNPVINVSNDGLTSLGQTVSLDVENSPNSIGQIASVQWDFDSDVDLDQDGIFTNDNDAVGFQVTASWSTLGSKIVTVTAISPIGESTITNTSVLVTDIVPPVPIISSSAELLTSGWKTNIGQETAFSCSSSSDDDGVASCLWEWGSIFSDTNTSIAITWANIGTYQLNLTVVDNSGNPATTVTTIVVDDVSIPSLDEEFISGLPKSTMQDELLTLSIDATDTYDQPYQLTYHWDLDPDFDSDRNGDKTDDPDYVGPSVDVKLTEVGRNDVVVTVFDQSGNSDSHAFFVTVDAPAEQDGLIGIIMVALFVGVITLSVAMIGFRKWQTGIALQLLKGRGLSDQEAQQHISMVKQRRRLPIFADAPVIAGLESGQQVMNRGQREQHNQDAEYQSIYGVSDNKTDASSAFAAPTQSYSSTGFSAPQNTLSSATQTAASDALAMFAEEENAEIIETNTADDAMEKVTKVISGGVALPHQVKTELTAKDDAAQQENIAEDLTSNETVESVSKQVACPHCPTKFNVPIPEADEAIVACPSCAKDFILRFS